MAGNAQSSFLQTSPRQASHGSKRTGLRSYKLRPGRSPCQPPHPHRPRSLAENSENPRWLISSGSNLRLKLNDSIATRVSRDDQRQNGRNCFGPYDCRYKTSITGFSVVQKYRYVDNTIFQTMMPPTPVPLSFIPGGPF